MLFARTELWLGTCAALLAAASPLFAQVPGSHHDYAGAEQFQGSYGDVEQLPGPYGDAEQLPGPYGGFEGVEGHAQPPYSAADSLDYMFTPHVNEGFFIQYDHLFWTFTSPDSSVLGDPASEHYVLRNGIPYLVQNNLVIDWDDSDFDWGHRVDFGYVESGRGWAVSVLHAKSDQGVTANGVTMALDDPFGLLFGYQDANGDGYDDDLDGDSIFGRSGQDTGTPNPAPPPDYVPPLDYIPDTPAAPDADLYPFGDLVEYIVTFGSLRAVNSTTTSGEELMQLRRSPMSPSGNVFELSWGLRYLRVKDRFDVSGAGSVLGATFWSSSVDNEIVGPQIGARWTRDHGAWKLNASGRFLAGINFQDARLNGQFVPDYAAGGVNAPVNLDVNAFRSSLSGETFSPIGELRLETAYRINGCVALRIGYTGIVAGGVSRAGTKVRYTLPNFEMVDVNSQDTVMASALHLGIEINR